MKYIFLLLLFTSVACSSQTEPEAKKVMTLPATVIGGPFENRELCMLDMPELINSVDTSVAWAKGKNRLIIKGKMLQTDGFTPVPNVILYYYHTDENGLYSGGSRHGNIRGWVKSDEQGRYSIYTDRPAPYPNGREAAHIHPAIIEPEIGYPYYLDGWVFDDDRMLTTKVRNRMENRGGSGVLRLTKEDGVAIAEKNIILGLNIPDHPANQKNNDKGRSIGEDLTSFTPEHVWGRDTGTKTCPICKYGKGKGLLYFLGEKGTKEEVLSWLSFLEGQCSNAEDPISIFLVAAEGVLSSEEMVKMAKFLDLKCVALTIASRQEFNKNAFDFENKNTLVLYKKSNIRAKYVDFTPTPENFELLAKRIDQITY